jgi:hypothetical protein
MSKGFDRDAWAAWRQNEIERHGNEVAGWIRVAENLIESGALLASAYTSALEVMVKDVRRTTSDGISRTPDEEARVRRGHRTFSASLMMFAFAIECLLKAMYLNNGGVLYADGKYQRPKGLKASHNLLEITEAFGFSQIFSDEDREILDLLSAQNEKGRYPVHTKFDAYELQPPNERGESKFYGLWGPKRNEQVFQVLQVIYRNLNEEIPRATTALLADMEVMRRFGLA